ncbi:MAG: FecR domain-containing protein [Flavobacteriaceae bacterium]
MDKNYILHKYLNGEASSEEITQLKSDPEFTSYLSISEVTQQFETSGFKEKENLEAIRSKSMDAKVKPLFGARQWLRIAAVVAIVLTSYVFLQNRDTSFTTEIAQKENFLLPDESEVTLNALSQVTYNKSDWKKERSLALDGQAYFKVKKGSTFSVNTSQGTVSVLGTQFDVFSRDNQFNITCYEGLVSVAFEDTTLKVPAGNSVKIVDGKLVLQESTTALSPSWITNESTFENASLAEVLDELKRQYPITLKTEVETSKKFTGTFTHTDINIALRSICQPLQLNYTIADNEVTIYAKGN